MAQLARETHKLFGATGTTDNFTEFGSTVGPGTAFTKDIPTIQSLSAWNTGWQSAVYPTNSAPFLEDMNAWCYEHSYQVTYLFQEGIPAWDAGTTYYVDSIVKLAGSGGQLFLSLQANNLNNAPPLSGNNAFWQWLNAPAIPIGVMLDFAGSSVPSSFLPCDGSAVSRTTYASLFAVLGTIWGIGDGTTTFNVPDFRRRVAVGSGGSGTATLANTVGSIGGEETHVLTIPEIPAHTHASVGSDPIIEGGGVSAYTNSAVGGPQSVSSTGGGGAHNNIQPSAVVTKIIRYQ